MLYAELMCCVININLIRLVYMISSISKRYLFLALIVFELSSADEFFVSDSSDILFIFLQKDLADSTTTLFGVGTTHQ